MTCTEVRRRLPAPEAQHLAQVEAHLERCSPCRGEAESLREVDRRLLRLGQARAQIAQSQRHLLDHALARQIGLGSSLPQLRWMLRWPALLTAALMGAALLTLWLRLRHR